MDSRELGIGYGIALASLYGHPKSDIKAGSRAVNEKFTMAKSCIPYYNIGVRRLSVQEERERAVKRLRLLNKHFARISGSTDEDNGK